jgi:hypothetical protein
MPTLEEIQLTPEQEKLMVEMIREVLSTEVPLKQSVYFQKWTKKIWEAAIESEYKEIRRQRPFLHWCYEWDGMLIDKNDPEFEVCTCFPKK